MSSWVTVRQMRDVIGKRNGPRTHLVGRTHMVPTPALPQSLPLGKEAGNKKGTHLVVNPQEKKHLSSILFQK